MGKFDKRESERGAARTTAALMRSPFKATKKLISLNVVSETYDKFMMINARRGIANSAVLNLLIEEYVKENEEKL